MLTHAAWAGKARLFTSCIHQECPRVAGMHPAACNPLNRQVTDAGTNWIEDWARKEGSPSHQSDNHFTILPYPKAADIEIVWLVFVTLDVPAVYQWKRKHQFPG